MGANLPPSRTADLDAVDGALAWVCFAHDACRRREHINEDKIAGSYTPWIVTQNVGRETKLTTPPHVHAVGSGDGPPWVSSGRTAPPRLVLPRSDAPASWTNESRHSVIRPNCRASGQSICW